MRLVVDTNVLFSFFRDNPVRFIIINSKDLGLNLSTPEYAIDELIRNKSDLSKYSGLNTKELEVAIKAVESFIKTKPAAFFRECEAEASKISPDKKDSPFFALALKLNADIWSNEPRLKRQSRIRTLNSNELLKQLRLPL